jgi:hypothetical protein
MIMGDGLIATAQALVKSFLKIVSRTVFIPR